MIDIFLQDERLYAPERSLEQLREAAALDGCIVVEPEPNEVQVDLDSDQAWQTFKDQYRLLVELRPEDFLQYVVRLSKSGNRHVTVTLRREVTPLERIALQAILGSDPTREALNYNRVKRGMDVAVALFRPVDGPFA